MRQPSMACQPSRNRKTIAGEGTDFHAFSGHRHGGLHRLSRRRPPVAGRARGRGRRRHAELSKIANSFRAHEFMLEDDGAVSRLVAAFAPDIVIHLAAQAGVRYSIENPRAYIDANVVGSFNILEACRARAPNHLLIASTSSVYGANEDF